LANPDKRLSPEFKSYQEFFNAKVSVVFKLIDCSFDNKKTSLKTSGRIRGT